MRNSFKSQSLDSHSGRAHRTVPCVTGDLVGRYIAPAGTPTQMLSLPYDKIGQPTTILQVQQSVEVLAGRVAPWFGQIGGGIQYQLGTPLDQLISEGIIKIFGG